MSKESAKTSIIVTCYNLANYLEECLDSVLGQTNTDWECIIVDDGSTDNTKDIAQRYCELDKRFYYHFHSNSGVANSRNVGAKLTNGEILLFLDADDKIAENYLEKMMISLIKDRGVSLVYCNCIFFDDTKSWYYKLPDYNFKDLLTRNLITVTALIRRSDFEKTNGFDQNIKIWEDWDFWLSYLDEDCIVIKLDEPLFHYRQRNDSRNKQHSEKLWFETKIKIYEKHFLKYSRFEEFDSLKKYIRYLNTNRRMKKRKKRINNFINSIQKHIRKIIQYIRK